MICHPNKILAPKSPWTFQQSQSTRSVGGKRKKPFVRQSIFTVQFWFLTHAIVTEPPELVQDDNREALQLAHQWRMVNEETRRQDEEREREATARENLAIRNAEAAREARDGDYVQGRRP